MKMNDGKISLILGKSCNWLSVVKCSYPDRYKLMTSFDSDRLKSIRAYIVYVNDLNNKLNDYLYENEDLFKDIVDSAYTTINCHKTTKYTKFLNSFYTSRSPLSIHINFLKRLELIAKLFEEKKLTNE